VLPATVSLESQGDQPVSFTLAAALARNQTRVEETWVLSGRMGKELKDIGRLRQPIHSEFANWGSTARDVERFTKQFGVLWECDSADRLYKYDFSFEVSEWLKDQKRFREWWRHQLGAKPPLTPRGQKLRAREQKARLAAGLPPIENDSERTYFDDLKNILEYREPLSEYDMPVSQPIPSLVFTHKKGIKVEVVAPDLWTYMILRLLMEKPSTLRVCQNKTCANPYFIATRKDQKFCDSRCSQLVASRRWYESSGRERRRERSLSKKRKGKN
jgi:hypothetical protein